VEVIRSAKRRRTVGAQLRGDVLTVTVPGWMNAAETEAWAEKMAAGFRRKLVADRIDLTERATTLARRYDLPRPRDIRWADDMTTRWGSCTIGAGTIRISTRVARFPDWVIDGVIVHELCHLEEPGHGPEFWRLAHRSATSSPSRATTTTPSTDTGALDGARAVALRHGERPSVGGRD